MELTDVAVDLYGLPLGEFTAARSARAKRARADGDRDLAARITALRKPTVAAWAVDLLVRGRPDVVEGLLALGERLQAAQAAFDGAALRDLGREQHAAMAAVRERVDALTADAGQRLTDAVHVQVEGTLRAAMADPDAAAAVRSGLLVGELVSSGFEPVDVGDAVAVRDAPSLTGTGSAPAPPRTSGGTDDAAPEPEVDAVPAKAPRQARAPKASRPASADGSKPSDVGAEAAAPDRSAASHEQKRRGQAARRREGDAATRADERESAHRRKAEQEAAAREEAARAKLERARREADEADRLAAEAAEELRAAEAAADDLTRRHTELVVEVETLSTRLRRLRDEQLALTIHERRARSARDAAARNAEAAVRRARSARERLEKLD